MRNPNFGLEKYHVVTMPLSRIGAPVKKNALLVLKMSQIERQNLEKSEKCCKFASATSYNGDSNQMYHADGALLRRGRSLQRTNPYMLRTGFSYLCSIIYIENELKQVE